MKRRLFILTALTVLLLSHGINALAQQTSSEDGKTSIPDFDSWTDEQFAQWEDSVKNALYPQPQIIYTPLPLPSGNAAPPSGNPFALTPSVFFVNSFDIDTKKAVGEIPVSSSFSPSGAICYSVPIEVYPGIRGFQPQLSLVYNSQSGDGPLGAGWNISGLSFISRTSANLYYDGKVQGVTATKGDAFVLDGQRLIKLSENASQISYETEQGYIKVNAILNENVVDHFEVYYPNGSKGIYGIKGRNYNYLRYPLTSISDIKGNTITYNYLYLGNEMISSITYSGASIEFDYAPPRQEPVFFYSAGLRVEEKQLVSKIICKLAGRVLRTYQLVYDYEGLQKTPLLSRIEYSAGNSQFNPLRFYYGGGKKDAPYIEKPITLSEGYSSDDPNRIVVRKGKFNHGDDNDGLILFTVKNRYWERRKGKHIRYENYYDAKDKIYMYTRLSENTQSITPKAVPAGKGFIDIICAGIDRSYGEKIVKINNYVNKDSDFVNFDIYSSGSSKEILYSYNRSFYLSTALKDASGDKSIHPKDYFAGDFNGDGKMEILAVSCDYPMGLKDRKSKCYLFDLDQNRKLYEGSPFFYSMGFVGTEQQNPDIAFKKSDRLFAFDYDGDGKTDILLINDFGTHTYTFNISGSNYSLMLISPFTDLKKADLADRELLIGEFNGDGKADLLLSPKVGASDWTMFYSMGNGKFHKKSVVAPARNKDDRYVLQDVNSDGRTDLIIYDKSGFTTHIAMSDKFTPGISGSVKFKEAGSIIAPVDINGSNYSTRLIAFKHRAITCYEYPRNDMKEMMMTCMINSMGVVSKNYYQPLNRSNFYSYGSGAQFPYENYQGPLIVPVTTELYLNGIQTEKTEIRYSNAVVHRQGLGFRGFEKVTANDIIRKRQAVQEYDPLRFGILKIEENHSVKNENTYSVDVAANRLVKILLTNRKTYNKPTKQTISSLYKYDAYGNMIQESVEYGGGMYVGGMTETVLKTYANNTDMQKYLLGVLTGVTKNHIAYAGIFVEKTDIKCNSDGFPVSVTNKFSDKPTGTETYSYDAKGNLILKSSKVLDSKAFETKYEYDVYGRLTKETDPLGFSTTSFYNEDGRLSAQWNHKKQATSFTYDSFGRLISSSHPDGTVKTVSLEWWKNRHYAIETRVTGEPSSTVCYDALGREIRSGQLRFNGLGMYTDKTYDNNGRLHKISLPGVGAIVKPSLWNEYSYDDYDRPISFNEASGHKTAYTYDGTKVTVTKDGISSTQTFDALGNLISVSDPAGTITYNRRVGGLVMSVVAPGNITTSFEYDHYNRRTSITDPSAGTQSWQYDAAGNVSRETDAYKKSTDFLYDAYNRLIKKTGPEFSTTYTYNSDGLLSAVSSDNGTSTAYTYDSFGRLSAVKESSPDGKWLQEAYAYSGGTLASTAYSSQAGNIATENYIYSNGHLSEIKLNSQISVWKLNSENSFGQPTDVTTGSFKRSYTYDSYGLPVSRTAGSFQSLAYGINAATGNLTFRKDGKTGIQENFKYDNLNRLTAYGGNTAEYDAKGNITRKSDIGTAFNYAVPGKPYAVSGITATMDAVSQRRQAITYTSFKRPSTITEGTYSASFVYNSAGDRVKMELKKSGNSDLKRYYLAGRYELDEGTAGTKEKLYVGGDCYTAPAVYVKENKGNWQIYYICRDSQGSITHVVNSSGSAVVQQLSYDAWGRLRNPLNQSVYAPDSEPVLFLGRGYTGHEHLSQFGLINMNARLYDPSIGRFLSPDPYVQAPDFSQSFNRYSYALNNPLKFVDSSGEIAWFVLAGAAHIGGISNLAANWKKVAGAGAALGIAATGGAGAGHVTGGTVANLFAGQNLGDAFVNSFDGIGKSMAIGAVFGVATTTAVSLASGVNPINGKNIYPSNNGFKGQSTSTELKTGQIIDRCGNENGNYFAPEGTPIGNRSLHPGTNTNSYNVFEVIKPFSDSLAQHYHIMGSQGGYSILFAFKHTATH